MSKPRIKNIYTLITKLSERLPKVHSYELNEELEQIRTTYSSMLHYMIKGIDDPNGEKIYTDLLRRCYILFHRSDRLLRLNYSQSEYYTQTINELSLHNIPQILITLESQSLTVQSLLESPNPRENIQDYSYKLAITERQNSLDILFRLLWVSDTLSKDEYSLLQEQLTSESLTSYDKSVIVSGITLGLLEMFDERKFLLLFDSYETDDTEVRMRSLVGIILCLRKHNVEVSYFPAVSSRLSLLFDSAEFVKECYIVMIQLQYSKLTNQVTDKMQNDIIPFLVKRHKFKKPELDLQEIDDYMTQNGENPEWLHTPDDEKAYSKIQEMAELQMEGADIYMGTFQNLKSYSFFNNMSNWFMPFNIDHPSLNDALSEMKDISSQMKKLFLHAPFCNSDKYSFIIMLSRTGNAGINMISQNLSSEMSSDDFKEHIKDLEKELNKNSDKSRQYIHDLYRFFHIFRNRSQFTNPFIEDGPSFSPLAYKSFMPLASNIELMTSLGEFFMRKEMYSDALDIFNHIISISESSDASLWQKIGFCQQKKGDLQEAYASYTTAYTIDTESKWTLKHLARLSYDLKLYEESEAYYDLMLIDDSENLQYLKRKVGCQIEDNRFEEAVPLLYKLYYHDENSKNIRDSLAYCLLMTGNTEKSKDLYSQLVKEYPNDSQLLMNLGNAYYIEGDKETSYKYYCESLDKIPVRDIQKFKQMFIDSAKQLKPLNIDIRKYQMMYDAVCLGIQ